MSFKPLIKPLLKLYPMRMLQLKKRNQNMWVTAWKVSKYGVFLFRIFLYSVRIQENTEQRKLRIWTLFMQGVFLTNKLSYMSNHPHWACVTLNSDNISKIKKKKSSSMSLAFVVTHPLLSYCLGNIKVSLLS